MVVRIGQAPAGEKPDLHDVEPCGGHADERRRAVAGLRRAGQAEPHAVVDRERNVCHASVRGRARREGVREPARLERRHPELGRIEGGDHLLAKGTRSLVDHRLQVLAKSPASTIRPRDSATWPTISAPRSREWRRPPLCEPCLSSPAAVRRSTIHAGMSPVARETPSASETAKSNTRQSMLTNTGTMACTRSRVRRMSPIDRPTAIEHARERLEGEQSHELGAGRPERQPNGELARLFRDAGQVQVGHVRAADREHDERQRQ